MLPPASITDAILQPLAEPFVQRALVGGVLMAVVCSVVGCFIVLRRMAFLGDAVAHSTLVGVTIGYLLMKVRFEDEANPTAMFIGAIISAVITVGLISFVARVSRIKNDTAIGVTYAFAFAMGGFIASKFHHLIHIDLMHFLLGDVLAIDDTDLWFVGLVAVLVLSLVILFYRPLQLASFDPVMATSIGVPVVLIEFMLTTSTALVVVSSVRMVGMVLVVGLLLTPAATAYLLCNRLSRMLAMAAVFGATSVFGGIYLAIWADVSGGPPILIAASLQFLIVLLVAPRYGLVARWWRRRQTVPQELLEKVLRSVLRGEGEPVTLADVAAEVQVSLDRLRRALRNMTRSGLLQVDEEGLSLTPQGHREARRVLRAHRLWETYLAHVGVQPAQLHEAATQLQHVHDEASVDYLDDKLGHPLRDPHGSEIPEDFEHLVPGEETPASLLREGYEGEIQRVELPLDPRLEPGVTIRMGPRRDEDTRWTVQFPDGGELVLDHQQADAIIVRVAKIVGEA